jgi:hypothetical protein
VSDSKRSWKILGCMLITIISVAIFFVWLMHSAVIEFNVLRKQNMNNVENAKTCHKICETEGYQDWTVLTDRKRGSTRCRCFTPYVEKEMFSDKQ